MKVNYKVLLVIWVAFGVAISGYRYIYPTSEGRIYIDHQEHELPILITVVGAILIGGLGYILSKKIR